jgi:hypothetical protein
MRAFKCAERDMQPLSKFLFEPYDFPRLKGSRMENAHLDDVVKNPLFRVHGAFDVCGPFFAGDVGFGKGLLCKIATCDSTI